MSGPSSRLRSTQKLYKKYQALHPPNSECVFCDESQIDLKQTFNYFRLVGNRFPYESWDDHQVLQHLMLVPIRHSGHVSEFTKEEKEEYIELVGKFELEGFSIYSRAPVDITRSVDHFHAHLLQIGTKQLTFMVYLRKPHHVLRKFKSKK